MELDRFSGERQPWTDFLPSTSKWAFEVSVEQSNSLDQDSHTVVGATSDETNGFALSGSLDKAWNDKLTQGLQKIGWKGRGSVTLCIEDHTFVVISLCRTATTKTQIGRQFGMDTASFLKNLNHNSLTIVTPKDLQPQDVFEGLGTNYYACQGFKKPASSNNDQSKSKLPRRLRFMGANLDQNAVAQARAMVWSSSLCRMLQDAPANWLDPQRFGDIAAALGSELGIKCTVLDTPKIAELGMGALLAVAQGSVREPKVIVLEIAGVDPSKTVALVGKGLTFDAGGISLKPPAGMGEMKYDMSGGAAVLATAAYLAKIKPKHNVVCIIGAVENMPSGSATRPGDAVISMAGKTIEILNTDAEGRLVLADLLHYAIDKFKPEWMVNIATLTGAVLHALGTVGAAMMANDDPFADFMLKVANEAGEPFWRLPLWPELADEVKGDVADLQNIAKASVKAGSIMGGMFLKEFVGKTKWAHLDIAGTGNSCKAVGYPSNGGSAFGLRTMVQLCMKVGKS